MLDDLKQKFREGDFVWIIISICTGLFLLNVMANLMVFAFSGGETLAAAAWNYTQFAMPLSFSRFIEKPWTLISNIFIHVGIGHLFFNMLTLYWFGQVYQLYLGNKYAWKVFFGGALLGCVLVLLSYNFIPYFSQSAGSAVLAGASGGILAIIFAATALNPEHEINLLLIGRMPMKYIAFGMILLNWISILSTNSGGVIAHLGGAFFGWFYMKQIQQGRDLLHWSFRKKMRVTYSNPERIVPEKKEKKEQDRVDEILDKIKASGYDSLSKGEKDFLFKYSQR